MGPDATPPESNAIAVYILGTKKDIKKNNDYAIRLRLFKKDKNAKCYLIKKNLAKYRIRKNSISHDKLHKKLRSHYDLFHTCDGKPVVIAFWFACWIAWLAFSTVPVTA